MVRMLRNRPRVVTAVRADLRAAVEITPQVAKAMILLVAKLLKLR